MKKHYRFYSLLFRPRAPLDSYFMVSRTQGSTTAASPPLETLHLPVGNSGHSSEETLELSDSDSSSSTEEEDVAVPREAAPIAASLGGLCWFHITGRSEMPEIPLTAFPLSDRTTFHGESFQALQQSFKGLRSVCSWLTWIGCCHNAAVHEYNLEQDFFF